jgi:hypothetical protein
MTTPLAASQRVNQHTGHIGAPSIGAKAAASGASAGAAFVALGADRLDAFARQLHELGLHAVLLHSVTPCFRLADTAAACRRALAAALATAGANGVAAFVQLFAAHIDRPDENCANLRRALRPLVARAAPASAGAGEQSLVRLLLGHALLQAPVAALLLERFCVLIDDEEQFVRADLHDNLPKLILRQLRFLECVFDGPALAAKLVEVLGAVPMFAKRELVACLPEIVDDSCHAAVVPALQAELEQAPELAVPILDAVAQLNVDPAHLAHTRRTAVALLGATRLRDTPLVVRFLILSAPADACTDTVVTLREQLGALLVGGAFGNAVAGDNGDGDDDDNDDDNVLGGHKRKAKSKAKRVDPRSTEADAVALLVDSLRSALASRRDVAKAWVNELEMSAKRAAAAAAAPSDASGNASANLAIGSAVIDDSPPHDAPAKVALGVADVWLLLCQRASANEGDIDALARRLVACDLLGGERLCAAVRREGAVELLGASAVGLAGALVRGSVQAQRDAGRALYAALFAACKSEAARTSLIGALVTHVGSSAPLEMEAALQTLVALAESRANVAALLQLAPYINGLLDFLESLSDAHVRLVFRVFTSISAGGDAAADAAAEGVRNELRILMHKQLAHTDLTYKRIGVIGAVTHLTRMASSAAELDAATTDEAADLVRTLFERASASQTCMALLFDELANAVPKLHDLLTSHVLTSLLHVLPPLRSREAAGLRAHDTSARFWYGHRREDGRTADERCCDVIGAARMQEQLQMLHSHHQHRHQHQHHHHQAQQQTSEAAADAAAALAASLRLAQVATRALRSGSVGDALRSSLHMFAWHGAPASLAPIERMTQARSLFYAGDWLRQTASGAALDVLAGPAWKADDERLAMVRTRIGDMLENERRLELFLRAVPDFSLPTVQGGSQLLRLSGAKRSASRAKPKAKKAANGKKKGAKRSKKNDDDDDNDNDGDDNDDEDADADADADVDDKADENDGADAAVDNAAEPAAVAAPQHVEASDSKPLVDQLRSLMRELDVAVFAAVADRHAIEPLVLEHLCGDFAAKLAAHAALEKPLTAKRSFAGAAAFLTAHTPLSAVMLVLRGICALPTHLARFHAQMMQRSRAGVFDSQDRNVDDDDDDDENDALPPVRLQLPGGASELLLESELLLAERAFCAICQTLATVLRSSAVRRNAQCRDALVYQLACTVAADVGAPPPPRSTVPALGVVIDHFARLGKALPRIAQFDTAAALLDTIGAMVELQHGADEHAAAGNALLSALAEQWLRAAWTRHRDGKLHAEPMRRIVHACVQHAPDKQATLRALASASARFNLAAARHQDGDSQQSPVAIDDAFERLLLPPPQMLAAQARGAADDEAPVVAPNFKTLTATTAPYWIAALNAELVSVFKSVSTAPSPQYVDNVSYICELVRVWRIVLETCNIGATPYVLRSALKDGATVVGAISELVRKYLQHHMIECIEPISVLLEDVARGSHILHGVCATTKEKKDSALAALVPRAKRLLEFVSLSLRGALIANKLSDSFSVFTPDPKSTRATTPHKKKAAAKEPKEPKEPAEKKAPKKRKPQASEKAAVSVKRSPPASAAPKRRTQK